MIDVNTILENAIKYHSGHHAWANWFRSEEEQRIKAILISLVEEINRELEPILRDGRNSRLEVLKSLVKD